MLQRKAYKGLKTFWASNEDKIVRIQAKWRMIVKRRQFVRQLAFFKVNEACIIRIQAKWKSEWWMHKPSSPRQACCSGANSRHGWLT